MNENIPLNSFNINEEHHQNKEIYIDIDDSEERANTNDNAAPNINYQRAIDINEANAKLFGFNVAKNEYNIAYSKEDIQNPPTNKNESPGTSTRKQDIPNPPTNTNESTETSTTKQESTKKAKRRRRRRRDGPPDEAEDRKKRRIFIVCAIAIALASLLFSAGFCYTVYLIDEMYVFFRNSMEAFYASLLLGFICIGGDLLFVYVEYTRRMPCNLFVLIIQVSGMTFICATMVARANARIILLALIAAFLMILVCLALAMCNIDFTSIWMTLLIAFSLFATFTIALLIVVFLFKLVIPVLHIAVLYIMLILQSITFVMTIQRLLGGDSYEYDYSEMVYIGAQLYTGIMIIFKIILEVFKRGE